MVVLIEPNAHRLNGHWLESLVRLVRAGPDIRIFVVTWCGIHPAAAHLFAVPGVEVLSRRRWSPADRMYRLLVRGLRLIFQAASRLWPRARWPDQLPLLERCLVEVACLRLARRVARGHAACVPVVLSAHEVLHRTAAVLGGSWHIRLVHEFRCRDASWSNRIDDRLRRFGPAPLVLCPTAGVAHLVSSNLRGVRVRVQTSSVHADADERLDFDSYLRDQLTLPDDVPLFGLFGPWWGYKANSTVVAALAAVTRDVALAVAGTPVPDEAKSQLRSRLGSRLLCLDEALTLVEYRRMWAGVDAVIISRKPGTVKESGQLLDAIRFGRPVVMADCPQLRDSVGDRPWIRWFRAGDPESVAGALEAFDRKSVPRPESDEASAIGVLTAEATLRRLLELAMEPR